MKILGIDNNAKTIKGQKKGYRTAITYLAPSDASGVMNTCPSASKGCRAACLYGAGRAKFTPSIPKARINKTKFFHSDPVGFGRQLFKEVKAHQKSSARKGLTPTVRLNGTSDIAWEDFILEETGKNVFESFPDLQFYDYTKRLNRVADYANGKLPKNYHLTFSRSENTSDSTVRDVLKRGVNVAVVYANELPKTDFGGFRVINGDENDLRFRDPISVVVGLKYKKTSATEEEKNGFVRELKFANVVNRVNAVLETA